MADLEQLLVVQGHDTACDQLEHRKTSLPIREGLANARSQLSGSQKTLRSAETQQEEAEAGREKLEATVAEADHRISEIEKRMFGGTVTAARDLESMSTEVAHLKERRSGLEDEALVAMEAAEAAAGAVVSASADVVGAQAEVSRLEAELVVAESEIDQQLAEERTQREAAAAEVPANLLTAYETLRTKLGGVGAARLVGDTCSGCHLSLPSGEIERLRRAPPDTVCYCDNCQRILLR